MQTRQTNHPVKTIRLVTMGVLSSILLVTQLGMAFLPNIEPVSTLIIVYTLCYKKRVFPIIYTFVLLEGMVFGFGIWWVSYLYIWKILALLVLSLQKMDSLINNAVKGIILILVIMIQIVGPQMKSRFAHRR